MKKEENTNQNKYDFLDEAEERAISRAQEAAYNCSEKANKDRQKELFDAMSAYMLTGIRLMREEIEKLGL